MPATGTTGTHYGTKKSKSGNTRAAHARGVTPNSSRNAKYSTKGKIHYGNRMNITSQERPAAQLKIDGEWYVYSGASRNHAEETARAGRIRAKGLKARIVNAHGLWAVYTRKA